MNSLFTPSEYVLTNVQSLSPSAKAELINLFSPEKRDIAENYEELPYLMFPYISLLTYFLKKTVDL
jgi:hypothetical protein